MQKNMKMEIQMRNEYKNRRIQSVHRISNSISKAYDEGHRDSIPNHLSAVGRSSVIDHRLIAQERQKKGKTTRKELQISSGDWD